MKKIIKLSLAIISIFTLIISLVSITGAAKNYIPVPISVDKLSNGIYSVFKENLPTKAFAADRFSQNTGGVGTAEADRADENKSDRKYLIPGGELVGIRLKTDGVLIVGTESFETQDGEVNPARDAGILVGDTLKSIDDIKISSNLQLAQIIEDSGGETLEAEIIRDGESIDITITPEISALTGLYKCGLWIRDSTGGIGTLTYCDIESGCFGTLGHGIYDTDTGKLLPTEKGELAGAVLSGVKKGISGTAGELKGSINGDVFAEIYSNNENGVYGTLTVTDFSDNLMPIAYEDEITTGKAQIISTVSGSGKEYFDIEIEKYNKNGENKNFIIKVTDERLLEITGGIIQGMSGSPIIQNGKIIGAVTHVFVNEPTKGYGITIENMLETQESCIK